MTRLLRLLRRDRRGVTIVEFALITPLLLTTILGLSELAYQTSVQGILSGAMQQAGRYSSIQGNQNTSAGDAIDAFVVQRVRTVARDIKWKSTRKSYAQFSNVAPEVYEDNNKNNKYDIKTECFIDVNDNQKWDTDPGIAGQGGASDIVVYRMDVNYKRLLPVAKLIGMSPTVDISATTILKNQPWRAQIASTPTKVCPK